MEFIKMLFEQNMPDEEILCDTLRCQGAKATAKRLAKAKNATFLIKASTSERSEWWMNLKEGKRKSKMAMILMASEYDCAVELLKDCKEDISTLKSMTESQKEEINLLKSKLKQKEEENQQLRNANINAQNSQRLTEEKMKWADEKIKSLEMQHKSNREEIKSLRLQLNSHDDVIKSLEIQCQRSQDLDEENEIVLFDGRNQQVVAQPFHSINFLKDIPDLEQDNFNYEFWKKIREWIFTGMQPFEIYQLIAAKCPSKAWKAAEKSFKDKISKHEPTEAQFSKLRECVTEALGPGTNQISLYYSRYQKDGELFRDYSMEKFRLYCSYGYRVDNNDPDINDSLFLSTLLNTAAEEYQEIKEHSPTTYNNMLESALFIEKLRSDTERKNKCLNCNRKGHIKAQCRRPGGGAEVGPNTCFSCGMPGHWARKCYM